MTRKRRRGVSFLYFPFFFRMCKSALFKWPINFIDHHLNRPQSIISYRGSPRVITIQIFDQRSSWHREMILLHNVPFDGTNEAGAFEGHLESFTPFKPYISELLPNGLIKVLFFVGR